MLLLCRRSTEFSNALKHTFEAAVLVELFPRSQIDVYVQVLQSDGGKISMPAVDLTVWWLWWIVILAYAYLYHVGIKSTCINAATLAIIDAGIPMKDYVCACSASFVEQQPILGKFIAICKCLITDCHSDSPYILILLLYRY